MDYSGLLVISKPGSLDETLRALKSMDQVDVFQIEEAQSRCIVVVEASTVNGEVDTFKKISELPSVMDVSLIVHHFDEDAHLNPIEDLSRITK